MSSPTWFTPLSEDSTVPVLPKVYVVPKKPVPDPHDVQEIEDQILRLAFGKAVRSIRLRTIVICIVLGVMIGFVGLAATLVVLLDMAGAR